jgi:hypothetical protein
MALDEHAAVETRHLRRLHLVRFFLPRLLAGSAHEPAHWWHALVLQQLGEWVVETYTPTWAVTAAEATLVRARLDRLHARLWCQLSIPPPHRNLEQSAADWKHVQAHLQNTMEVVVCLLRAAIEEEEQARAGVAVRREEAAGFRP